MGWLASYSNFANIWTKWVLICVGLGKWNKILFGWDPLRNFVAIVVIICEIISLNLGHVKLHRILNSKNTWELLWWFNMLLQVRLQLQATNLVAFLLIFSDFSICDRILENQPSWRIWHLKYLVLKSSH